MKFKNPFKKKTVDELVQEMRDMPVDKLMQRFQKAADPANKTSPEEAMALTVIADDLERKVEPLTWNRAQRRAMKKKRGRK